MTEITIRECRFGGSKLAFCTYSYFIGIETKLRDASVGQVDYTLTGYHTRWSQYYEIEERARVLYRNWATRVSVRWF